MTIVSEHTPASNHRSLLMGDPLPNLPWEDRPANSSDPVWRYSQNPIIPHNRNGVLFPRKINGNYAMFSRPSDTGHTPFGDIFYSESPDLVYWGKHRFVMGPKSWTWESTKIGAGPTPIETPEGWLLFY